MVVGGNLNIVAAALKAPRRAKISVATAPVCSDRAAETNSPQSLLCRLSISTALAHHLLLLPHSYTIEQTCTRGRNAQGTILNERCLESLGRWGVVHPEIMCLLAGFAQHVGSCELSSNT